MPSDYNFDSSLPEYSFPPTTVVSLLPFSLSEIKPGMHPSEFVIEAAKLGDISTLVIRGAIAKVKIDNDRGSIDVPQGSEKIARSICQDFIQSQLEIVVGESEPGLFWIKGDITPLEVKTEHVGPLTEATRRHTNWCKRLVAMADDIWQRYRQHRSITDSMRYAAEFLGLQDREWAALSSKTVVSVVTCPSCAQMCSSLAAVCHSCRCILDADKYAKLNFASQPKAS